MKKNYFLLLCGLLLSVSAFVACSEEEPTPAPKPTFPEPVSLIAEPGEVIELDFEANYDWSASISEDTYTYFQLLSGETAVNKLSGTAGKQTIKVNVVDEVVYDNAPVAEVTLTMSSESHVIATITYPTTQRNVAVYAPKTNKWGSFESGEETLYSYNTTAMTDADAVTMSWGVERKNYDDADSFYAPVLVETNFDYTLAGPEWMIAAEAGKAGKTEYIIKADVAKIPAESETAAIEVLAGEQAIASFKVAITGANDFVPQLGFAAEAEYAFDGEAINGGLMGSFIAGNFAKVVCDATGAAAEWLTVSEEAEDGEAVIKNYNVTATAAANDGATSRTAYVFYFAKNAAPADNASLFENGAVKEEYAESLATVVTQYTEPATIEGTEVDDTCATFAKVGADFADTWFFDDLHLAIGSKYTLHYWGEWAVYAHEYTYFTASRPIKSISCYAYNDMGSLVKVAEDNEWVRAATFGTEADKVKFRVYCEDLNAIPESAKNWQTGDGEATIVVEHTDGSYSAIYFHISGKAESGDAGVSFVYPEYAGQAGATLVELKEGDELYDNYFSEYSSTSAPAKFYHLTYEYPMEQNMYSLVQLAGLDGLYSSPLCEWAYFDADLQAVVMESAGASDENPGVLLFKDGNFINKVVILCTLKNAE